MHSVMLRELAAERAKDITATVDGVQRARRARRSPRNGNSRPWRAVAGSARAARTRLTSHAHTTA